MLKDILQGKPFRHPLHTFLVHFPIGLFSLSLLLDLASLAFPLPGLVPGAFYCLLLGIVTALIAAVPGFVDYTDIPRDRPARRVATAHMVLNLVAVAIFAVGAGWRSSVLDAERTPFVPLMLSVCGMAILAVSGYLGGYMVYDDGVGVGRHRREAPPREAVRLTLNDAERNGWETRADTVLVPVVEEDALHHQETVRVSIDALEVLIVNLEGRFYAVQEFCTHRFGPLSEGDLRGGEIMCPWHRSCFDVRTGRVTSGPAKMDLKTFPVEVRSGKVCIAVPRARREFPAAQDQPHPMELQRTDPPKQ